MGSMATFNVKKNNAYLFLLCSRNHVTNYLATLCPNFLILHLYNLTSLTSESEFKEFEPRLKFKPLLKYG